jgi:very-short-patch-repair endonuclease
MVTRAQLLRAGLGSRAVDYRVKVGRLLGVHRGIYRVGPIVAPHSREMAAALSGGRGAALVDRTAAVLWDFLPGRRGEPVHVGVRHSGRLPPEGVRFHKRAGLGTDEVTRLHGIAITRPERTLLDLAASARARDVEQALGRADRLGRLNRARLTGLLDRYPRRAGTPLLRQLLAATSDPRLTRSEAERLFLALLESAGLGDVETNVLVLGEEVDVLWRAARLIVEIDGWAFHSSPASFEEDRRRDRDLTAAGYRVMRFTWRQLQDEPNVLLVRVAQALAGGQ